MADTYKVERFYKDHDVRQAVRTGLTLAQAREHCADPETSSSTCTTAAGHARTNAHGAWFEGFNRE